MSSPSTSDEDILDPIFRNSTCMFRNRISFDDLKRRWGKARAGKEAYIIWDIRFWEEVFRAERRWLDDYVDRGSRIGESRLGRCSEVGNSGSALNRYVQLLMSQAYKAQTKDEGK
jgi:hypothetical protein